MFLLMLARNWEQLAVETNKGNHIRITGYAMPIEGGGRMQVDAFMPLFSTYEHAEAARGTSKAPIYELSSVTDIDPDDFEPFDPETAEWV